MAIRISHQMNGTGNGGPGSVIIVKEAARGGGGIGHGPGLQRLLELNSRNLLRAEEGFSRNPPLRPSPSEAGRIFEAVDGSRRNSSRTDDNDVQIMQLDDDTRYGITLRYLLLLTGTCLCGAAPFQNLTLPFALADGKKYTGASEIPKFSTWI